MRKQLFLYTILIVFTGLVIFFGASIYITRNNYLKIAKDEVIETAQIYAGFYDEKKSISDFVHNTTGQTRITVVAPDGTVLADSRPLDTGTMENHIYRPEIQSALKGTPQTHVRYSDTLGVDLIYYAVKVDIFDDNEESYVFVRASIPVGQIDKYLISTLPLLIIILILLSALCFVFIRQMANRITSPFNLIEQKLRSLTDFSGKYDDEPIGESYDEIDSIIRGIDEIALILQNSIDTISDERSKLNYILDNIEEGLFTTDENGNITLINKSVLKAFDAPYDIIGKDMIYLSGDKTLTEGVRDCIISETPAVFEITNNGKILLVTVKRLPNTDLTMTVLSDVTENRESSKRRENFFANASHELKTPLTAIKCFNELTVINNNDDKINKYVDGITRETERMLLLIGDMLKLSELDYSKSVTPSTVWLPGVINEARDSISAIIDEKSILFEASGDCMVTAEQKHIYELVKNLIENAVRYTDNGGKVTARIENNQDGKLLIISDNGIGIPTEDQSRIFERFYRVEKSRSEQNGGTGLGLSIVKHICVLYDWKLSLKSKVGVGTEVTVEFS
ncbi:MAG: ATP-binding protein [Oscillospiraceae bacterium]|nr:ATP-binding protein [Oscillospiraceae bacterium]